MMSRRRREPRRRNHRPRQPGITSKPGFWVASISVVFLALGLGVILLAQERAKGAPLPAVDELTIDGDVVSGDTVVGVHEMNGATVPTAAIPAEGAPKLVLDEQFHDFGTVRPTDKVDYTFPIRNEGEGTLTISRVYTTCGCTTAELSSRVIPPGKEAELKVVYDAGFHKVEGEVLRDVILEANDPSLDGPAMIRIRADVQG
jgi:hypothetical protein